MKTPKMFIQTTFILVALGCLSSCDNGQIVQMQKQLDSLSNANKELQSEVKSLTTELDGYRYSPEKLCASIDNYLQTENISMLNEIEAKLVKYHPDSEQLTKVRSYISSIQKAQQARREAERAKRLQAVNILEKKYDDVQGITWYYSRKSPRSGNFCYLYIGKKKDGRPWLRLKMQYRGEDWIFFEHAYLSYDGTTKEIVFDKYDEKETEVSGGVYEWIDVSVESDLRSYLENLVKGNTIKWQFRGKYDKTVTMSRANAQGIGEILLAYDVLNNEN